jgi:hypothetical protein
VIYGILIYLCYEAVVLAEPGYRQESLQKSTGSRQRAIAKTDINMYGKQYRCCVFTHNYLFLTVIRIQPVKEFWIRILLEFQIVPKPDQAL